MRVEKYQGHTITAWAEATSGGWHGLASVEPALPNTWTGGPHKASLLADGVEPSEKRAEDKAFAEALAAIDAKLGQAR